MDIQERTTASYRNLSERFYNQNEDYKHQYCRIYTKRLEKMTDLLAQRIEKKWGSHYPIFKLHKLAETTCDKCVVVGTLFKDQKLKPSLLKQLAEANHLLPQPFVTHFTDESDALHLEDELQRYRLIGLDAKEMVTGISCALLGNDLGKGRFQVDEVCFVDFRPQVERPLLNEDVFVVLVSGLNLVNVGNTLLPLRMFVNWIADSFVRWDEIEGAKIARVIIAGNSIRTEPERLQPTISLISKTVVPTDSVEAVKVFDAFLHDLAQVVDVDVLPGKNDPSNNTLPQKPMHHSMFPKSHVFKALHQVSNPYECEIEGVRVLGTSGQPVTDILNFSEIEDGVEALGRCLRWSHVAPTAPDTLGCYPFYERDPFVVEECPHVMFAGNQSGFATKVSEGEDGQRVRLICVPEFAKTFTAVVLNLKNLECFPVMFELNK